VYDLAADQRRKIANQRNIQELAQKGEDIERLCVVLGGILATIRAGNRETLDELTQAIRNMSGIPELSFYVNGLMAIWPEIYLEFQNIDFYLDDAPRKPSVEGMEHMEQRASVTADSISDGNLKEKGTPHRTAQQSRVLLDTSETKRSATEPHSSARAMGTGEHIQAPAIDGDVDEPMEFSRVASSDSQLEGFSPRSPRSNRTARPWELP
jgi:hypothetical protein